MNIFYSCCKLGVYIIVYQKFILPQCEQDSEGGHVLFPGCVQSVPVWHLVCPLNDGFH